MKTLLPMLLLFASCSTLQSIQLVGPSPAETHTDNILEKMMPNGHWDLSLHSYMNCDEKIKSDKGAPKNADPRDPKLQQLCIKVFQSRLKDRATALCGDSYKFYGCALDNESMRPDDLSSPNKQVMTCYLQCNPK